MPADQTAPAAPPPTAPSARRFAVASAIGGALALAVFAWLATLGQWDLGRAERLGDFYDVQGRAFLEGRWDVPPDSVTIEGIVTDGRTYIYFGPVPTLLRLPVLAVTDRFDGRMTAPSLLLAFTVALVAVAQLSWRIRGLVGPGPWRRRDDVVSAATIFFVGTGTVLLFPASRLLVYHEAILWGVALSLLAYHRILVLVLRPGPRALVLASVTATAAFLTRASVGLGPVVALAVVAAVALVQHLRSRRWTWPQLVGLAGAVAVPVVAFASVSFVKFETLYSLPLDRQVFSRVDANRQAALRDNGGSLFGARFVPSTLAQYARPDAVRVTTRFPYVQFPRSGAAVIGDVTFDTIDRASSVPAAMPAATALAGIGAATVLRRKRARALLPVVAGTVAGASTALTIAFIAHRYLGDALPLVIVLALVGVHRCSSWRWSHALLAPLAALSVAVNLGLALQYQRAYSDNIEPGARAEFLAWQDTWSPRGLADVTAVGDLLTPPVDGGVFVIGRCAGVYWSDGERWHAAERTAAVGRLRARTVLRPGVVTTDEASGLRVVLEPSGRRGGRLVMVLGDGRRFPGRPLRPSELGRAVELDLAIDRRSAEATAHVDGRLVLDWSFLLLPDVRLTLPEGATPLPMPTPLCDQLAADSASGSSS